MSLKISCSTTIKIFNTLSHILYKEISKDESMKIRTIYELTNRDLALYKNKLEIDVMPITSYKISVHDSDYNVISKIYITFSNSVDSVYAIYRDNVFADDPEEIHIILSYDKIVNGEPSEQYYIIYNIFYYIMEFFSDKADTEDTYKDTLSILFTNLIIDSGEYVDAVGVIMNNYLDPGVKYIKIKNDPGDNLIRDYIKSLFY